MENKIIIPTNEFQTPITQSLLDSLSPWVQEQFMDFVDNVPLIRWMVSPDRPRAKDLARDSDGKIIVDIAHPHILEDMDYFRPAAIHYETYGCYTFLKPNQNPKSEYGKWIIEEVRRCREGYVRESDGEWVTGLMYYYLNYSRIKITKKNPKTGVSSQVPGFPLCWEGVYYRYHYIDQARKAHKHCIELARRGAGKAHPYTETVVTPDGVRRWGDIEIGDKLFGDDGNVTTVTDIPFDGVCPTYKITLRDGREILASEGHLWRVKIHNHKKESVLSTKELLGVYARKRKITERVPSGIEYICGIPSNNAVEFETKTTAVDPYTFGVLLGDGCFRHKSCYLCENDEDFDIIKQHIPYEYVKWNATKFGYRIAIPEWQNVLSNYGLANKKSEDKFIPDEFKFNSKAVRLAILKGLVDTDGYLDKHQCYCISTASKRLASDIRWICWSLGYNNTMVIKKAGYKKDGVYKQCLDSYIVNIYTTDALSNIPRKIRADWSCNYAKSRAVQSRIVNIEYIGEHRSKCVTVDNASHCYLINDFVVTHNSYSIASLMDHNLHLGENEFSKEEVNTILAGYTTEYLSQKDGTLDKFVKMKDFVAKNTEFPRLLSTNRPSDMLWIAGSKDANGTVTGSKNSVMGVAVKDDESKVRGKRGFILFEEMGSFKNLLPTYNNVRDSVKDGDEVFALIYLVGTAGDKDSDFSGAREILYNPEGYEIYPIENVYDFEGKGRKNFGYFFPSYISRTGCVDKDGNSDVVKALITILQDRDNVRRTKPETLLSVTAQRPITPEEAILRVRKGYFPTDLLNERLRYIDQHPHFNDSLYVGTLVESGGKVIFKKTDDIPIRDWPIKKSNIPNLRGALEILHMPSEDDIPTNRYVLGIDPIENDQDANSESLFAMIMFDLFNDEPVAWYYGRMERNEDNCYLAYLLCRFYNAKCMPEANKKNVYAYFAQKHALYMLADCPDYLKERDMVKYFLTGSSGKGVQALPAIISYAQDLIKDWLLKQYVTQEEDENGHLQTVSVPGANKIACRALLKEMISYGPGENTDLVSALMQCMLYRQQYIILYREDGEQNNESGSDDADDEFFYRSWNKVAARLGEDYHFILED